MFLNLKILILINLLAAMSEPPGLHVPTVPHLNVSLR